MVGYVQMDMGPQQPRAAHKTATILQPGTNVLHSQGDPTSSLPCHDASHTCDGKPALLGGRPAAEELLLPAHEDVLLLLALLSQCKTTINHS